MSRQRITRDQLQLESEIRTCLNIAQGFAKLIYESNNGKEEHEKHARIIDEALVELRVLIDEEKSIAFDVNDRNSFRQFSYNCSLN